MPAINLSKALQVFGREIGCSDSRDFLLDTIQAALEFMLMNGGGDILREWKTIARGGRFTLPPDLEMPIKWKWTPDPTFGYGTFNSAYFSYSSQGVRDCCGYNEFDPHFLINANKVPTQFAPPIGGVRLVATTRDKRDVGKQIMVGGKRSGMLVAPLHNGFKTAGELLTIYHEDDSDKKYGAWIFDEILSVTKDPTCAYVMLSGINESCNQFYFLSHYHPDEETPSYTEGELRTCCGSCDTLLHILGRINPSIRYIRDEDVLPITSFEMLRLLAKRARYDESGDYNEVAAMETRIKILIKKEVAYQQPPGRHLSFSLKSGGAIRTNM